MRLRASVLSYDTIARLGGDEFGLLLPLLFWLEDREIFVSYGVGIAVYSTGSETAEELLKCVDLAMYIAKRSGRNSFRLYSKDLTERAQPRLALESDLRCALARGELAPHY